jgi:hypothetical protein
VVALALVLFALTAPTRLHVQQVVATGSPLPVEGSIPYVRVARADGSTVVQRRLKFTGRTGVGDVSLAPGRYRLQSWQRYCDGNCSLLDPPSDRCSRWFRIHRGQTLKATVTVTYGSGCRIAFAANR